MGKRFASFLSLFGVCTLLESKLLKIIYILNVNISMTVGRIFTKNISLSWAFFRKPEKFGSFAAVHHWRALVYGLRMTTKI